MASALSALKNATITFNIAGTGTVTDPVTGNVSAKTTTTTVEFYLVVTQTNSESFPGVQVTDTLYEGYAVDPKVLPSTVGVGTEGTLDFAGTTGIECEVLEARMPYGTTGLLGKTLQNVLGDRVRITARTQTS
jgi:hypothetical protein|tara:strand:- start:6013 stop:6411 length:399 start_codon:yes stop_codon:yes gene_type:complete